MKTRTVIIHDNCTNDGCGRTLHSILEGERGTCSSCWVKSLKPETRAALDRLIGSVFDGSNQQQKEDRVADAMQNLLKEEPQSVLPGQQPPAPPPVQLVGPAQLSAQPEIKSDTQPKIQPSAPKIHPKSQPRAHPSAQPKE